MKTYIAFFEPNASHGFGVIFPDLPGLMTMGDDYQDAYIMAHKGLQGHVHFLETEGELVPEPRTLEEIQATWEEYPDWQGTPFMPVPITLYPLVTKPVRINVVIDGALLERLDYITDNRSAYITNLLERSLP